MTEPFSRLERSLRDGPPDETGYRARRRDLEIGMGARQADGITPLQRVIRVPRVRHASTWSLQLPIAVLLVSVIAVGGVVLATRNNQSITIGPPPSSMPGPSHTSTPTRTPGPTASSSPTPVASIQPSKSTIPVPPLTKTFVSARNGFSIDYPADWTATPATQSWPSDTFIQLGNPELDELTLEGKVRLVVASQRLDAGQTEADWVAAYFRPFQGSVDCANASELAAAPRLLVDGESGYMDIAGCPMSADAALSASDVVFNAFVFVADRVYQITLDGDVDLAYFEAFLATMKLDPGSAIDPPATP
jgi:hypothetical protein